MITNQSLEKESISPCPAVKYTLGKACQAQSQIENNFPERESEISPEAALIVSMSALQEKSLK